MKLKVTNIFGQPYGINPVSGSRTLKHGESYEGEFSEGEARNLNGNSKVFAVEGYVEPAPGQVSQAAVNNDPDSDSAFKASVGPIANRLGIHDGASFTPRVTEELDKGDKARNELAAIAELFGTPEIDAMNVKAAVERLIQDHKELRSTTERADDGQPADLAAAVALLDDKNDEHWTQAGQPKISALESLLGKQTSAAEYGALPEAQKRTRKTA